MLKPAKEECRKKPWMASSWSPLFTRSNKQKSLWCWQLLLLLPQPYKLFLLRRENKRRTQRGIRTRYKKVETNSYERIKDLSVWNHKQRRGIFHRLKKILLSAFKFNFLAKTLRCILHNNFHCCYLEKKVTQLLRILGSATCCSIIKLKRVSFGISDQASSPGGPDRTADQKNTSLSWLRDFSTRRFRKKLLGLSF